MMESLGFPNAIYRYLLLGTMWIKARTAVLFLKHLSDYLLVVPILFYVKESSLHSKFVSELQSGGEDDTLANVGLELPEAKSRILCKSKDVLVVVSMTRR